MQKFKLDDLQDFVKVLSFVAFIKIGHPVATWPLEVARNLEIYNRKKSFTKCNMSLYGSAFKVTSRYKHAKQKKVVHMGYFSIVHCPTSIPILNRTGKYCCSLFLLLCSVDWEVSKLCYWNSDECFPPRELEGMISNFPLARWFGL